VGGRIGIHGSDEPVLNRGNINWTTGCISVDDEDVEELKRLLPTGTVVIIKP
jgi:lipoprotein-anchoring transpeptidase ErfK/SrfK